MYFIVFCLSAQLFLMQSLQSVDVPEGWVSTVALDPTTGEYKKVFAQPQFNGSKNNIQIGVGASSISDSRSDLISADNISPQNAQSVSPSNGWQWDSPERSWFDLLFSKETFLVSCCTAGIAYTIIYYQLQKAIHLVHDKTAWCNWKKDVSIERLYTIERKELAKELLHKIQARYMNPKNPTDHIAPMNLFIEDYRRELLTFRRYFKLAKWFKKFYLMRFFPFKKNDIHEMKQSIERLCYLKSVFFNWTKEYKTTHCLKNNSTQNYPDPA